MTRLQRAEREGLWFLVCTDPTGDESPYVLRTFKGMVRAVKRLSAKHPHVRVDYEDRDGNVNFVGIF